MMDDNKYAKNICIKEIKIDTNKEVVNSLSNYIDFHNQTIYLKIKLYYLIMKEQEIQNINIMT